jgi:hypothetical protein
VSLRRRTSLASQPSSLTTWRSGHRRNWGRLEEKAIVQKLLGVIVETIEGFTYHRQWANGGELALEFCGRVGGLELQGIDVITLDDAGRIAQLDVMIRPINALLALRDRVAERMAG